MRRASRSLASLFRILSGILQEIADERPYQRHLAAHGRPHSPQEWRRFQESRLGAKYQRAKCC